MDNRKILTFMLVIFKPKNPYLLNMFLLNLFT